MWYIDPEDPLGFMEPFFAACSLVTKVNLVKRPHAMKKKTVSLLSTHELEG